MKPESATPLDLEAFMKVSSEDQSASLDAHGSFTMEGDPQTNVVDWDGPDNPRNPYNWPKFKKLTHVLIVSAFSLNA